MSRFKKSILQVVEVLEKIRKEVIIITLKITLKILLTKIFYFSTMEI